MTTDTSVSHIIKVMLKFHKMTQAVKIFCLRTLIKIITEIKLHKQC